MNASIRSTLACLALACGHAAWAGGYTALAVPTRIDVVRSEGFMVYGAFGNPGGCTFGDQVFVKLSHTQYKQIYAAALAAYMSKNKVVAYVGGCEAVTWYSIPSNTFGIVDSSTSLSIAD